MLTALIYLQHCAQRLFLKIGQIQLCKESVSLLTHSLYVFKTYLIIWHVTFPPFQPIAAHRVAGQTEHSLLSGMMSFVRGRSHFASKTCAENTRSTAFSFFQIVLEHTLSWLLPLLNNHGPHLPLKREGINKGYMDNTLCSENTLQLLCCNHVSILAEPFYIGPQKVKPIGWYLSLRHSEKNTFKIPNLCAQKTQNVKWPLKIEAFQKGEAERSNSDLQYVKHYVLFLTINHVNTLYYNIQIYTIMFVLAMSHDPFKNLPFSSED